MSTQRGISITLFRRRLIGHKAQEARTIAARRAETAKQLGVYPCHICPQCGVRRRSYHYEVCGVCGGRKIGRPLGATAASADLMMTDADSAAPELRWRMAVHLPKPGSIVETFFARVIPPRGV